MRVEILQRGVVKAYRELDDLHDRASDVRPAWDAIMEDLQDASRSQFQTGRGWAPTDEDTKARDARGGRDPRLMRVSGALENSLTQDNARGAIRDKTPREMRYGTSIFYAAFHQFGQGVPERKLVDVDARMEKKMAKRLENYLLGRPTL